MKNILAFMDGSAPQPVLDAAFCIGRRFASYIECRSLLPSTMDLVSPEAAPILCDYYAERAGRVRDLHRTAFQSYVAMYAGGTTPEPASGITARFHEDDIPDLHTIIPHVRMFDLLIVPGPNADVDVVSRNLEAYLSSSAGCPILIVPKNAPKDFGSKVYLIWSDSQHGSRLLASSMPLLKQASEVVVSGFANTALEDVKTLVECLTRHGAPARECSMPVVHSAANLQQALFRVQFDLLLVARSTCQSYSDRILNRTPKCIMNSVSVPVLVVC